MSNEAALIEALRTIMAAHKFNVATLKPCEVHIICFDALAPIIGEDECAKVPEPQA